MTTRVYKYGLLPPTLNADRIHSQLQGAHDLANALVEMENGYRYAKRQLLADIPEVVHHWELEQHYGELCASIKAQKQLLGVKSLPQGHPLVEEKARQLPRLKSAQSAAKPLRDARFADPEYILMVDRIDRRRKAMAYALYTASGVTSGTRALVVDAHKQADAALKPWQSHRFRRIDGRRLRIGVTQPSAHKPTFHQIQLAGRSKGGRRQFATLRMRVGSDEKARPIWGEWPMVLHRPLPPGKVATVCVSRSWVANRPVWTAEITVNEEWSPPEHGVGTVAVNLGWRTRPDGLRVLYCADHERSWEVVLPSRVAAGTGKAESLRAIRDANQNTMAPLALSELRGVTAAPVRAQLHHAHAWKSPVKWHRLFRLLRTLGISEESPTLAAWYHQDIHLWQWEAHQRRKALAHRKDFYRVVAAQLARQYDTLLLAKVDRSRVARDKSSPDAARHNRTIAANYELEGALVQAFAGRQGSVYFLPADWKTQTCHNCGELCAFEAKVNVEHVCEHCGSTWDQDENHCQNLLEHFRERPSDGQLKGGARAKKAKNSRRRDKMAALSAIKQAKIAGARETAGNPAE